jgi:hypothetical protein
VSIIIAVVFILLIAWLFKSQRTNGISHHGAALAQLVQITKSVSVKPAEGINWEDAKVSETLYGHDSVMTYEKSTALVHFKNGDDLTVLENSLITIDVPKNAESPLEISLKKGTYRLKVKSHEPVKVGSLIIDSKLGGEIEVSFIKDEPVIQVSEGIVEVQEVTAPAETPVDFHKGQTVGRNDLNHIQAVEIEAPKAIPVEEQKENKMVEEKSPAPTAHSWPHKESRHVIKEKPVTKLLKEVLRIKVIKENSNPAQN